MSRAPLDQAGSVQGHPDQFKNLPKLFKEHIGEADGGLLVEQFPSGFSNLTYLVRYGEKEYVLRRPPVGADIRSAHDMAREYKVLSLLKPIYHHVPAPLFYCEDESVIGAPFYVMERVRGVILRSKPPEGVILTPELMKNLSEATVDHLVELHNIPLDEGFKALGKPEGYVKRQVEGWIQRYFKAETDTIENMDRTAEWLRLNMPTYDKPAFIHNDFKYDNLVLDPGNLTHILAVLDWEMATIGDPLMDLGTTLGYWVETNDANAMKYNLTWLPGNLTREEAAQRYSEKTGKDIGGILFYYVFGLFKIGVIVQQIYARYKKGIAKDPRFAGLIHVLNACADNAQKAITLNRISHLN